MAKESPEDNKTVPVPISGIFPVSAVSINFIYGMWNLVNITGE